MNTRSMAKSSGPSTRGPGRPRKTPKKASDAPAQTGTPVKRGRGRPPRNAPALTPVPAKHDAVPSVESSGRKPGRPWKNPVSTDQPVAQADHAASQATKPSDVPADSAPRRGRGRPPRRTKSQANRDHGNDTVDIQNPPVDPLPSDNIPTPDHEERSGDHPAPTESSKRKRGRPRKRGKSDFTLCSSWIRLSHNQLRSHSLAPSEPPQNANETENADSNIHESIAHTGENNAAEIDGHAHNETEAEIVENASENGEDAGDMASGSKRVKKGIARPLKRGLVSPYKPEKCDDFFVNDGEGEEEVETGLKAAQDESPTRQVGRPPTRSKTISGKKDVLPALELGDAPDGDDEVLGDDTEKDMPAKKKQRSQSEEPKAAAAKNVTSRKTKGKAASKPASKTTSAGQSERAPSTRPPSRAKVSDRSLRGAAAPTAPTADDSIPEKAEEVRPVHTAVLQDLPALGGINNVIQQLRQAAYGVVSGTGNAASAQTTEGNDDGNAHDSAFGTGPSSLAVSRLILAV